MTCVIILAVLLPTITAIAGDIPESLLHSEDAEIFFGEVIAYRYRDMRCGIIHMGYSAPAGVVFFYTIPFIIGIVIFVAMAVICHKKGQ